MGAPWGGSSFMASATAPLKLSLLLAPTCLHLCRSYENPKSIALEEGAGVKG